MSILVTGGAGYIGSHTCLALLRGGYDVIIVDNLSNSNPESVARVEELAGRKTVFYRADIRDAVELERVFRENSVEAVIHFAGLKAVKESTEKPLEYYENNVGGTLSLCRAMSACGCKKMVFSSSATVYNQSNVSPLTEDMPAGETTNPYGTTKYFIERILADLCKADQDWRASLLRYFNPIGADKSGRIGEAPNGRPNNLVPFVAQVAVGKHPHVEVTGTDYPTPDGTGIRDYLHVSDLADGHIKALERRARGHRRLRARLRKKTAGRQKTAARRRHRRLLLGPLESPKVARLESRKNPRRNVRRFLALAKSEPRGLLKGGHAAARK